VQKKIRYTFIASSLLLAGCYFYIFYSYRYGYWYEYLPFISVLAPLIWLFVIWLKYNDKQRGIQSLNSFLLAVACFCVLYALSFLQKKYLAFQIARYGITTGAKVIGETRSSTRRNIYYHAIIRYQCNQNTYLQSLSNNDHFYKYGDSLRIVCSSVNPEILKVVGYKPALAITH